MKQRFSIEKMRIKGFIEIDYETLFRETSLEKIFKLIGPDKLLQMFMAHPHIKRKVIEALPRHDYLHLMHIAGDILNGIAEDAQKETASMSYFKKLVSRDFLGNLNQKSLLLLRELVLKETAQVTLNDISALEV